MVERLGYGVFMQRKATTSQNALHGLFVMAIVAAWPWKQPGLDPSLRIPDRRLHVIEKIVKTSKMNNSTRSILHCGKLGDGR
jgi:hypothetical protein